MEALSILIVVGAPWPFASVHPYFQAILYSAIGALLALWALRIIAEKRTILVSCSVSLAVGALCLIGILQSLPLPRTWVERASPEAATLRQAFASEPGDAAASTTAETDTISIAPGSTRSVLQYLIAVTLFFCAIRSNLTEASFRRLSYCLMINGVLLSVVGISQAFSSPGSYVFWSIPTQGATFGPFICRNHFAYYANICIGLSLGLLIGVSPTKLSGRSVAIALLGRDVHVGLRTGWILFCLTLTIAGLVMCQSRGGLVAGVSGLALGSGVLVFRRLPARTWAVFGLAVPITALLLVWLGLDRSMARWSVVWDDLDGVEGRPAVWLRTLRLAKQFAISGSGLGTARALEPMTRSIGGQFEWRYDHLHNDYLEAIIEGGSLFLAMALVALTCTIAAGFGSILRDPQRSQAALACGAAIAVTTAAVHSFVDFGLHTPAVAIALAAAAAIALNRPPVSSESLARGNRWLGLPFAGVQVIALAILAAYLTFQGWQDERAERYRLASRGAPNDRRVLYLEAATQYAPDQASLHSELAVVLTTRACQSMEASRAASLFHAMPAYPGIATFPAVAISIGLESVTTSNDLNRAKTECQTAIRSNPLDWAAQQGLLWLALLTNDRSKEDACVRRLLKLNPAAPAPWYAAGWLAVNRGDRGEAFRCWRNAIEGDRSYLRDICSAVPAYLTTTELLEQVMPADLSLLYELISGDVGRRLPESQRPTLLKAAGAMANKPASELSTDGKIAKARILRLLDQLPQAKTAFEAALLDRPFESGWRFEYADLLRTLKLFPEARREVLIVLQKTPSHAAAQELHRQILKDALEP
jgi:tetratricopeptide (TPR) repeat protein